MSETQKREPEELGQVKQIRKMSADFDGWYTDVIRKAEMADYTPVAGSIVLRPYGMGVWQGIQRAFDDIIAESGHENWYFPLLIPEELLMKEAEHIEGFAPEVAWVTRGGKSELDRPLAIRPTSETIIGTIIRRYIQSYRDLPLLTNQWCNVVRWEMRTRLFLRSREFLWQEGHTFHATTAEAEEEVLTILEAYRTIAEDWLAIPSIKGRKSDEEKFAGAVYTTSIESMMRDGLALQAGTSHYFGQNFTQAYDINFTNHENRKEHAYSTSWGMSWRLIGGLVMAHGDDNGLVMPPRIAPVQVAVIPIFRDEDGREGVRRFLEPVAASLKAAKIRHKVDWRDVRPGDKYAHWEVRGVPFRIEVGMRDVETGQVVLVDRMTREKRSVPVHGLAELLAVQLERFQGDLFARAETFRDEHTIRPTTWAEFEAFYRAGNGFAWAPWCARTSCELEIKEKLGVTTRNQPFVVEGEFGDRCIHCDQPSETVVIFARAY